MGKSLSKTREIASHYLILTSYFQTRCALKANLHTRKMSRRKVEINVARRDIFRLVEI